MGIHGGRPAQPATGQEPVRARPPGMLDVARTAGVSHQTVSRVLNDHPNVRPETRDRVLAAIAELGYRRNSAARALVTSRSGTIGVLTTASALFGPVSTLISVEEAARQAGLFVSVASLRGSATAAITDAIEHFRNQSVEGIIVIAPQRELAVAAKATAPKIPIVMIAAGVKGGSGFHTTAVDQLGGARLATRHLLDLGHRSIAHLGGPANWFDATARLRGWTTELKRADVDVPAALSGDWTAESGYAAGLSLLRGRLPSAVFCANDLMALGLIRALTEAGVSVPQDISVIGFDDIDGAGFFQPPLTTVRQDFTALGQQCVELLLSVLAGTAGAADPRPITPELVLRHSTAAPG